MGSGGIHWSFVMGCGCPSSGLWPPSSRRGGGWGRGGVRGEGSVGGSATCWGDRRSGRVCGSGDPHTTGLGNGCGRRSLPYDGSIKDSLQKPVGFGVAAEDPEPFAGVEFDAVV